MGKLAKVWNAVYYEYDGIYQLVKEDRRESDDDLVYINYFEYDLAGNRTHLHYVDTSSDEWTYYTYNIENQLTIEETGGTATYYEYDPAGALLSKKTGDDESSYQYNFEGLMDEYASGENTAYFTFDANNRRIWAKRNGTEEKYVLSGNDVVADYDGEDTVTATYNTPSLDSNLTKKIGENVYFYVVDGLGSIRNILDSNETAQNAYDYLAFGSVYGSPTENVTNRYRFTAREWESIPSLHYYRARMMDQSLGRFLSKDPQFATNLYVYVLNNPNNFLDSSGTTMRSKILPEPEDPYDICVAKCDHLLETAIHVCRVAEGHPPYEPFPKCYWREKREHERCIKACPEKPSVPGAGETWLEEFCQYDVLGCILAILAFDFHMAALIGYIVIAAKYRAPGTAPLIALQIIVVKQSIDLIKKKCLEVPQRVYEAEDIIQKLEERLEKEKRIAE